MTVLSAGVVSRPDVESLLTALRRVTLLEIGPERRVDPKLKTFLVALVQQMWCNEFVWYESAEETGALDRMPLQLEDLLRGGADAEWTAICQLLYRPPPPALHQARERGELAAIRFDPLRSALQAQLETDADVMSRADRIPSISRTDNPTSAIVSQQYEAAPYPRWTGTPVVSHKAYLAGLSSHFPQRRLAFFEKPFDVLIAGCGTGKQAVSGGLEYGPNARVLAIDIARRGLGYAEMMADRLQVRNVSFAVADINVIDQLEPTLERRFQVIECAGVLHHMADPFSAWQKLIRCLAPGGIMLVGLYSEIARQSLNVLRSEPGFPGIDADDAALRNYRQYVRKRLDDLPGGKVHRNSLDFYSASGFRDYFLHVSEQQMSLPQISRFLDANGMQFHGFVGQSIDVVRSAYPGEPHPGSLDHWAEIETRRPALFSAMYQFWISRKDDAHPA